MKLIVQRHPNLKEEVEGPAARAVLREVLTTISQSILFPVMPHTGIVRRRAIEALKAGRAIWSENDDLGNPSSDATILTMPMKIVGIIKEDGTYEEVGASSQVGNEVAKTASTKPQP